MTSRIPFFLIFIFYLLGCDTFSHIRRDDPLLPSPPKLGCIERGLKKNKKVQLQDYYIAKETNLLGYMDGAEFTHVFSYDILLGNERYRAKILVKTTSDGKTSYSNVYSRPGSSLNEMEKKIVKPNLELVDKFIAEACDIAINSREK